MLSTKNYTKNRGGGREKGVRKENGGYGPGGVRLHKV